jgi:hypothetical protein
MNIYFIQKFLSLREWKWPQKRKKDYNPWIFCYCCFVWLRLHPLVRLGHTWLLNGISNWQWMFLFLKVVITFFECCKLWIQQLGLESHSWMSRSCQIVNYKQIQVAVILTHKELTLLKGKQLDDQVVWQGKTTSKVWQEVEKGNQ